MGALMTRPSVRETAYAKFLNSQTPSVAAMFMLEDLKKGPAESMAWDVMAMAHGQGWKFAPYLIPAACEEAARILRLNNEDFAQMMDAREPEMIRVCDHCEEEIRVLSAGDESWDYCPSCRAVEGDTKEITLEHYEAKP